MSKAVGVATQAEDGARGRQKVFYIKPDVEERAKKYCKEHGISFSLFIRNAVEEYLNKQED